MTARTLPTRAGSLTLVEPPAALLERLRARLPAGLVALPAGEAPAGGGVRAQKVMADFDCVTLQQPDCLPAEARAWLERHRLALARGVGEYVAHGFGGVLVACTYLAETAAGSAEAGLAFFAAPDPRGVETRLRVELEQVDERLGAGSSRMVFAMAAAHLHANRRLGLPPVPLVGLDLRPRRELGTVSPEFLVVGSAVGWLAALHEEADDPTLAALVAGGVGEVVYLPAAAVRERVSTRPREIPGAPGGGASALSETAVDFSALRRAVVDAEKQLGRRHPAVVAARSRLADVYRARRRLASAETRARRVLETLARMPGTAEGVTP